MTDWLDWLLEELEEDEDQGEDLDLKEHVLPGRAAEGTGAAAEERSGTTGAVGRVAATSAVETAEVGERPAEDRMEGSAGQGEDGELPLVVRQRSEIRLAQAARQAGAEQPWQTGTPAGTGEVRTVADSRTVNWLPAGGETVRAEAFRESGGNRSDGSRLDGDLYAAVRRTRAAAEQTQGLRQAGPVVIREPVPVGDQSPTPAELDRIFQRDARRYDGGFTLF